MKEYTVVYKDGSTKEIACQDKADLINNHFENSEEKFKNEVVRLMWNTLTMRYVEDVAAGKVNAELSSADVNPYGWRDA